MARHRKKSIAVLGGAVCDATIAGTARLVGKGVAERGGILICGGRTGVMEAACRGAKEAGGLTIGILPGHDKRAANPYVEIPLATGMGEARNCIIVRSADAAIAIDGSYGTLSEISFCLKLGVPIVGLNTWDIDPAIHKAKDAYEAVAKAFLLAARRSTRLVTSKMDL